MNFLGIDYGKKRFGIAYASAENKVAVPLETVSANSISEIISRLKSLIQEREIGLIVMGLPLDFKMKETQICQEIKEFGAAIEQSTGVKVEYLNEVLSSDLSKKVTGKKDKDDAVAAEIILGDYLLKYHEPPEK
jgi:putative Holliday junction resolvase